MELTAVPVPLSWRHVSWPLDARRLAIAAAVLGLACLPDAAWAAARRASTPAKQAPVAAAQRSATPPGVAWAAAEPAPQNCSRSRRKLWQPGEGWMVRTVTTCRD